MGSGTATRMRWSRIIWRSGSRTVLRRQMARRTFYRVALVLPLVAPLLLWAALYAWPMSDADSTIVVTFLYSLMIGGLPYLVFAAGFARWMRDKSPAVIRRGTLWAPLLFMPWLLGVVAVVAALRRGPAFDRISARDGGLIALMLCLGVLVVGYAYVGITEGARWLADRFQLLGDEEAVHGRLATEAIEA